MDVINDGFLYDPSFHRFSDFLGLDKYVREDFNTAKKVMYLYDWSKEKSGSEKFVDIIRTAVKFKRDMGQTTRGKTLVNELYKWARLDEDSSRIQKEKSVQKEQLTDKEQKAIERQERILDRASKWEGEKESQKKLSEDADKNAQSRLKEVSKQQKEQSKLQKEANIKLKDVVAKPKSEEIQL